MTKPNTALPLRQRIARALLDSSHDGGHGDSVMLSLNAGADAVLAAVQPELERLTAEAERLAQERAALESAAQLLRHGRDVLEWLHAEAVWQAGLLRRQRDNGMLRHDEAFGDMLAMVKNCTGHPDSGHASHFDQIQTLRRERDEALAALEKQQAVLAEAAQAAQSEATPEVDPDAFGAAGYLLAPDPAWPYREGTYDLTDLPSPSLRKEGEDRG